MRLYKMLFELLPSPTGNMRGIGGIVYADACSRCGFGDEEQVGNLRYIFRSKPATDLFSGLLPEPLINEKVHDLLVEHGATGVDLRPVEVDPRSDVEEATIGPVYQMLVTGTGGPVQPPTKTKRHPDWCNKCGRNRIYVVDEDETIYYDPARVDNVDFLKFDDQIEVIVADRIRRIFEQNGVTGVSEYVACVPLGNDA